ncbi:MAG TPA: O-antigen ligase family protein [Nitrospirae bacterium]|nr:O-Antigen ligase [bacterium BMS3Abin10]GBE39253.1 O-Antigen ligase [bacterium BMS3Bbin08]HDH51545.1 O-antigen ligase family protein [Nitrospirota bacterium]HDK17447.1 O-antigen ligase family protein [Nitrospirota bacterium]HDO25190.1 O-antigen ligase family protein [Nitrospirota bacterium]
MKNRKLSEPDLLFRIMHFFMFVQLILLPFPHVTSIKEITFWLAVFFWLMLRSKRSWQFMPLNPVTVSLSLFMAIALITSLAGIEPMENIKRFKGELLIPFLFFLIASTEYNSMKKIRMLLAPMVAAFAIYTVFVVIESCNWGLSYYWDQTLRQQLKWYSGYAEMSITLLPLTLGYFLLMRTNLRFLLLFVMLLEFTILAAYRHVASFGGTVFVIFLGALFIQPKTYRLGVRVFIIMIMIISASLLYTHRDNPAVAEYRLKLYQITHPYEELKRPHGFTNRVPLWKAGVDVIKDRPVTGYGWGMKKYTNIVAQDKYLNKWKTDEPEVYKIYTRHKGRFVPPHNLILELAFQSGILGLVSFMAFIFIYVFYMIKYSVKSRSDEDRNFSIIIVLGTVFSFMIANIMSNELGRLSGKVLFIVLGAGTAWMENKKLKNSTHSSAG